MCTQVVRQTLPVSAFWNPLLLSPLILLIRFLPNDPGPPSHCWLEPNHHLIKTAPIRASSQIIETRAEGHELLAGVPGCVNSAVVNGHVSAKANRQKQRTAEEKYRGKQRQVEGRGFLVSLRASPVSVHKLVLRSGCLFTFSLQETSLDPCYKCLSLKKQFMLAWVGFCDFRSKDSRLTYTTGYDVTIKDGL